MQNKLLDEAIDDIMSSLQNTLEAKIQTGEDLDIVKAIYRGDRSVKTPKTPCIWIFPDVAICAHPPTAIMESWEMPINLVSVFYSNDAEEGYRRANELAARARTQILKNRDLGLNAFVQDARSGRFEPSNPAYVAGNNYSAVAVIKITFNVLER